MIKKVLSILLVALISGSMAAQEAVHERPQRTPEEEAVKQTQEAIYSTINLMNQNILALAELEQKLNEVLKNGNV